ncbi:AI-2E family transporter [Candidatus Laterigemmans baculatus]|uniref:AI-2E family transporter n=1 Tax=Candidatus Laterigemmans baculatus TaxID=2770505 RepID=UPI0013DC9CBA|nr:AI-2E family transporter [Candidatus Laterigemmans baculatus]
MAAKAHPTSGEKSQRLLVGLATIALAGGLLYVAKAVLVPIALAVLLTFLLAPAVIRLQRLGLPKGVAVLAVATLAFALIGGVGWLVSRQLFALAQELPEYRPRVEAKVEGLKESWSSEGGVVTNIRGLLEGVQRKFEEEDEASAASAADRVAPEILEEEVPVAVRVAPEEPAFAETFNTVISPLIEPLAMVGLVLVLVLFMLFTREDLRNRIVSLSGQTNLAVTTKALDEAGKRIARYLVMQAVINSSYGIAVTVGLFFLDVPYALLWGVAAAVLRYIPYVGPWVAAVLPLGYSVLTSSGWWQPLGVLALIAVLELVSNNVMEPLLYGHGVGVSSVGVILAAVFWGWLWGPVGLVLATPLTICLVVAGRYFPALSFFNRLLGDVPEVEPHIIYYQRLLAKDDDEAEELFDDRAEREGLAAACQHVLVPALELAKRDRLRGLIEPEQYEFILDAAEEHLEEVPEPPAADEATARESREAKRFGATPAAEELPLVLGYGLRDQADEALLAVMSQLLDTNHCRFVPLSRSLLISEVLEKIRNEPPAGFCLLGLPPGGLRRARTFVKRLRTAAPELKIAVGRWGPPLAEKYRAGLLEAGATYVGHTPEETRRHALSLARLQPAEPAPAHASQAATTERR